MKPFYSSYIFFTNFFGFLSRHRHRILFLTLTVALVAHFFVNQVMGQKAQPPAASELVNPSIRTIPWPAYEGAKTPRISITRSTSQILRFDRQISRTAISNPNICDITPIGGKDVLVNAKTAGIANLLVWDSAENIAAFDLESTLDLDKLNSLMSEIDSEGTLKILPFNDTVAVYGKVQTSVRLKQVAEVAKAFDKNAVSFADLKDPKQVLLEVRFAEINRKNNKDFRLDIEALGSHFATRSLTGATGSSALDSNSSFTPRNGIVTFNPMGLPTEEQVNLFGSYIHEDFMIENFLRWLEEKNVLKIIARPNLLAKDGKEASFIVGGEFPVPISNLDRITIHYKEFGTKLKFTPEILDGTMIRLAVDTEVSELDFSNTVNLGGIVVPSIIKRRHETVSELKDKQSLVIGGLLTQKISHLHRRVPVLGSIPLIGRIFTSDAYDRTDVELLVVITPHIIKPFELKEKKEFYDPKTVDSATRTYNPMNADPHGDAIHSLIVQNEDWVEFNTKFEKFQRETAEKFLKENSQKLPSSTPPAPSVPAADSAPKIS